MIQMDIKEKIVQSDFDVKGNPEKDINELDPKRKYCYFCVIRYRLNYEFFDRKDFEKHMKTVHPMIDLNRKKEKKNNES